MSTFLHRAALNAGKQIDDPWVTLYKRLPTLVKHWVYNAHVNSWYGQENDVAYDIVLFAVERTYEYSLKAARDGIAILSLEKLSVRIARNHFLDLLRKERRIVHFDQVDSLPGTRVSLGDLVDPSEIAFEMLYTNWLFTQIAHVVARFPDGTRTALLIDLANRMYFEDEQPTTLQLAFLNVGIRLQDYQQPLPDDPIAKSRYASLLSVAYKRLAKVIVSGNAIL